MCVCIYLFLGNQNVGATLSPCLAVRCRALPCVAVCYIVLPCVAVRCRARLRTDKHLTIDLCCSVLQCVAVCCRVVQCVAVCCSVLQCVAVCCNVLQCVYA